MLIIHELIEKVKTFICIWPPNHTSMSRRIIDIYALLVYYTIRQQAQVWSMKMFISGTVQGPDHTNVSVERLPSGRLTKWCEADFTWRTRHSKTGEGQGNGPELKVTIDGTEYATRNVQLSGGSNPKNPRRVTARVELSDGRKVRLVFQDRRGWDLVASASEVS